MDLRAWRQSPPRRGGRAGRRRRFKFGRTWPSSPRSGVVQRPMSDIARLLHFVERKNAGGVEKEIERGADVNQREAVRTLWHKVVRCPDEPELTVRVLGAAVDG